MRVGLLGGSFDPVHLGHLLLAECSREQLALDEVWFLPAAVPPHKQGVALTPAVQRVEMLELAIAGNAGFRVGTHEVDRGGVNFTVDTLTHLHGQHPEHEWFFLMGADSLVDFPTWREPGRVAELAVIAVVQRAFPGGQAALDLTPLSGVVAEDRIERIRRHRVEMPRIDLSASDLRQRLAAGKSIRYRTPRAVEKYIETHGLYRTGD